MRVRIVLLALPLLVAALPAQDQATVVSAGKGWTYNGKVLLRGQVIDKEHQLSADMPAGELLLDCPRALIRYVCDSRCNVLVCVGQSSAAHIVEFPAWAKSVVRPFLRLEPREVAALGVRGGGNPVDALLLMDVRGVHWGPALARVLEGRYCLRLTPLPSGTARVFTIDWDRATDAEGVTPAPGVAAGIYSLDKGTPGAPGVCTLENDARAAWVVVAPEAQFNRVNPGWKQRSAEIAQLERSDAGPDAAATLRHAVLASLSDSVASK